MRRLLAVAPCLLLAGCAGMGLDGIKLDSVATAAGAVASSRKDFTPDEERALGRVVAARVIGNYGNWKNEAATRYVNLVGQTVARQVGRPGVIWRFALLDTDTVNAFSCPGGYVLVTRGLLDACRSEAELAAVLAHECGHVAGEHVLKEIKRANLVSAGLKIVATQAGGGEMTADLMQRIGERGFDVLISRGMDRKDELDADARGCRIASAAGYATAPYGEFLDRLATRMGKESGGALASLAKTHPPASERRQRLQDAGLLLSDGQVLADRFAKRMR
ncbi:MAG TPA: M48 family metalloprotease [Thermoanaerobaculaceae bacterium]|nr:M48 family metalloprotease [Thermoanaerobaculaceae bacterium]HPS78280.1 M48 family metalloprotease [Thermoanaerobaculaceae bacterium]